MLKACLLVIGVRAGTALIMIRIYIYILYNNKIIIIIYTHTYLFSYNIAIIKYLTLRTYVRSY